jgi:hypothetical protein
MPTSTNTHQNRRNKMSTLTAPDPSTYAGTANERPITLNAAVVGDHLKMTIQQFATFQVITIDGPAFTMRAFLEDNGTIHTGTSLHHVSPRANPTAPRPDRDDYSVVTTTGLTTAGPMNITHRIDTFR